MLLDVHHGFYYENFSDADVEDGCHILVRPGAWQLHSGRDNTEKGLPQRPVSCLLAE